MHALALGEHILQSARRPAVCNFVIGDDGERLGREGGGVLQPEVQGLELGFFGRQIVSLFTGNLARTAADAFRRVDQESFCHRRTSSGLGPLKQLEIDQAGLRLLTPGVRIAGINREDIRAVRLTESLVAPVVRHPDDEHFLAIDGQGFHAPRHHRLDGDFAAGRGDRDAVAGADSQLLRELLRQFDHGFRHRSFSQAMLRVTDPPLQCSAMLEVMST